MEIIVLSTLVLTVSVIINLLYLDKKIKFYKNDIQILNQRMWNIEDRCKDITRELTFIKGDFGSQMAKRIELEKKYAKLIEAFENHKYANKEAFKDTLKILKKTIKDFNKYASEKNKQIKALNEKIIIINSDLLSFDDKIEKKLNNMHNFLKRIKLIN